MADGWKYYNHALIPATAPHEEADLEAMKRPDFWKRAEGKPLFARWVTDFDCPKETGWWYVIKDTPFDISKLKSNRRYKITKGTRYFEVKRIDPLLYSEELFHITIDAYSDWPEKYRPVIDHDQFVESLHDWKQYWVYGAFLRENGKICGYSYLTPHESYLDFNVLRTMPEYEKFQINAAIIYRFLEDYREELLQGKYICDGSRSISHETNFQDYLENYFFFRKAYCKIHLKYKKPMNIIVSCLFPFRRVLSKLENISIIHNMNSVLFMEQLFREQE